MRPEESRITRLIKRVERSWLGNRLEGLGALSPLATLRTFAPGAQVLLASAERDAERGLHLARAMLLIGVSLAGFWAVGPEAALAVLPGWLVAVMIVGLAVGWWALWRLLRRPTTPGWLRYSLVVVDAILVLRVILIARGPLADAPTWGFIAREDLLAMAGPMLLYVAVSGAFRFDPRLAVFSTACALASYALVVGTFGVSTRQAVLVGLMIWLSGFVAAQAARVFRHMALKAAEQAVIERYVPEALTRELARTGDLTGEGTEAEVTVLIVDIRGYTRRSERLSPRESVAFLNDYFAVVVAPLAAEGAVLDKYIGDGVFSFFQGPDHPKRAMRAARRILEAVDRFNVERASSEPLRIGVAIHTGPALVGTIGSAHKREYTVIADAVNVAARLEELNKHFGSVIVVSDDALRAAGTEHTHGFVGPHMVELRGHEAPLPVHYLPVSG